MAPRAKHEVYNSRAKSYDFLMNLVRYPQTLKFLLSRIPMEIPANAKILDLGCGTGLATQPLKKRFASAEITGIDFSMEMIVIYKRNFSSACAIAGDFNDESSFLLHPGNTKIGLPNSYFDLVISTGALSEYGKPENVMPFIRDKLKKKGILINIGVNKNFLSSLVGIVWRYSTIGKNGFIAQCRNFGFNDIKSIPIPLKFFPNNYWRYIAKARK